MATVETDTSLCRVHGLEVDCEVVAISTAFAVTAVRVLDLEVFQAEHGHQYLNAKSASRLGSVVDGFVLIRNAEIHLPAVLDPDAPRVLNLGARWRVLPRWKPYAELPSVVQTSTKTAARCHAAYQSSVQGTSVIESLLDALKWFLEADPSIAQVDREGELEQFPLPELWQHDYERRHPMWRGRADVAQELRIDAAGRLPTGERRTVQHRLNDRSGNVLAYCGYTHHGTRSSAFTEFPEQVVRDVGAGYCYEAGTPSAGGTPPAALAVKGLELCLGSVPLAFADLWAFGVDSPDEDTWRGWFELIEADAFKYVQQRRS